MTRTAFVEDFLGHASAAAATCSHSKRFTQFIKIVDPGRRSATNLFVRDRFADADVHRINRLGDLAAFKRKCE